MLVQVKPIVGKVNSWEGTDEENLLRKPKKIRATIGRNGKYQVAIDPDRLKELEQATGFDLSLKATSGEPHPFWDMAAEARVTLKYETMVFDDSVPKDEIQLGIMRAHDIVANNISEADADPLVQFVIYSEEEEASKRATKVHKVSQCFRLLEEVSRTVKNNVILILRGRDVKEHANDDVIMGMFGELIDQDPDEVLKWLKADIEDINLRALAIRAMEKGELVRDGAQFRYGDLFIGTDVGEVVKTLRDTKNQALVKRLREKVDN